MRILNYFVILSTDLDELNVGVTTVIKQGIMIKPQGGISIAFDNESNQVIFAQAMIEVDYDD